MPCSLCEQISYLMDATMTRHALGKILYLLLHVILILLGVSITQLSSNDTWAPVTISIGTSLVAAGAAGIVLYLWISFQANAAEVLSQVSAAGIVALMPFRSSKIKAEYDKRLASATKIEVLGLALSAFREDYRNELRGFASRADMKVLLLDPDAPNSLATFADLKDREEGLTPGRTRTDIIAFVREGWPIQQEFPDQFQIRLYRGTPAVNFLRLDDEAFWGPYLVGGASRNMPTFVVRRGGYLFRSLSEHFDSLWKESEPLTEQRVGALCGRQ